MKPPCSLDSLLAALREIHHLKDAAALLSWDQETYMPPGGGQARADQLATLQTLAHDKFVSAEMESLLGQWVDLQTGTPLPAQDALEAPQQALLRETWRDFSKAKKLPSSFVNQLERECSLAQQVWTHAQQRNAFADFLPHLRTIIKLKLEETHYLGFTESPYDALLDTYEPGATVTQLRPLFTTLREALVPLLQEVLNSANQPDVSMLHQRFDSAKQVELGKEVLKTMGYDFTRGRLDLSAHPFTTSFHPSDVRVTTRVFEDDLQSCLFSCIHEGGHGLYDQGLPPEHYGTPLAEAISLGIHESQSRLWENCVGRSKPFWDFWFPRVQALFPDQLQSVSLDQFYAAINTVKPSLIRVEADELTYNLHIMLRFEIELDLIEGRIQVDELPDLWNAKMQEYVGVTPTTDTEGVLQDVHWSLGAFGYFPTYTLGNLYAAMLFEQATHDLEDLPGKIAAGRLLPLKEWLNQKVHRWGRQMSADELIRSVTGQSLTPKPFLAALTDKVRQVYGSPSSGTGS